MTLNVPMINKEVMAIHVANVPKYKGNSKFLVNNPRIMAMLATTVHVRMRIKYLPNEYN